MITKNIQQTLFYFLFIFLTIFIFVPEQALALCTIDVNGTYIEAEDFTGTYNLDTSPPWRDEDKFDVVEESGSNGGWVIVAGDDTNQSSTPDNEVLSYKVNFGAGGDFFFWARGRAVNTSSNSMFYRVRNVNAGGVQTWNSGWRAWNFPTGSTFSWTDNMQVGVNKISGIPNTADDEYIDIAMRERGSVLDGFFITTNAAFTPTTGTVPSTVTSISPKDGCDGPAWTVDPGELGPTCFKGYNAASTTFTITNTGNANDSATATITSDQTWVVIPDNTVPILIQNASHTVPITYNTSALAAGTHTATLTINGGVNNLTSTITVTLLVKSIPSTAACGEIPLYAENLINPAIMVQLDTSGSINSTELSQMKNI